MLRDDRATYCFSQSGLWPSQSQELLLQAALWEGEAALEAWRQWRSNTDIEGDIERGTFRLLPLLYQSMLALGVRDPIMRRLGSVYRWSWVESNQILRYMRLVLQAFEENDIRTLLLKGAALAYVYYPLPGMRPMADFDVMVPLSDVPAAVSLLKRSGWQPMQSLSWEDMEFRHSRMFANSVGEEFDLHWHVLFEIHSEHIDNDFWRYSVSFEFDGLQVQRLDTTDNLFHAIVHGIVWNPEPPIRWIADAMMLLKKDGANVQWERIIATARRCHVSYRLALGLRYLKERMRAPIPDHVLSEVMETPIRFVERIERRSTLTEACSPEESLFGGIWRTVPEYLRYANARQPAQLKAGFLQFLVYRKQAQNRRRLGALALQHFWRWIKRRVQRSTERLTEMS